MLELFQRVPSATVKDFLMGFAVGCNSALREHRAGIDLQDNGMVFPSLALYYALRFGETPADRLNKAVGVVLGMAVGYSIASAVISYSNMAPEEAKPLLHRFF